MHRSRAVPTVYQALSPARQGLAASLRAALAGYRIARGPASAADASPAEVLQAQATALARTIEEVQHAAAVLRSAEVGLRRAQAVLGRIRALPGGAAQAGSRTGAPPELAALTAELAEIARTTQADGRPLLDGTAGVWTFGFDAGGELTDHLRVDLDAADLPAIVAQLADGTAAPRPAPAPGAPQPTADPGDALAAPLGSVASARQQLQAGQERLGCALAQLTVAAENLAAAQTRVGDTDPTAETVCFSSAQILTQTGSAMLAQANSMPQGVRALLG
jgi:flagellin